MEKGTAGEGSRLKGEPQDRLKRTTVDLDPKPRKQLKDLEEWSGGTSAYAIRKAISIVHFMAEEVRAGASVKIVGRPDGRDPVALAMIEMLFR